MTDRAGPNQVIPPPPPPVLFDLRQQDPSKPPVITINAGAVYLSLAALHHLEGNVTHENIQLSLELAAGTPPRQRGVTLAHCRGSGRVHLNFNFGDCKRLDLKGEGWIVPLEAFLACEASLGLSARADVGTAGSVATAGPLLRVWGSGTLLIRPSASARPVQPEMAPRPGPAPLPENLMALRRLELFRDLPDAVLSDLAHRVRLEKHAAGAVIFNAGDTADALFIVQSGVVEILGPASAGGSPLRISTLGSGECFGEMALLSGDPRSATVRAIEPVTLFRVGKADFLHLVQDGAVYSRIVKILCERLRTSTGRIEEVQRAQLSLSRRLQGYREFEKEQTAGSTAAAKSLDQAIAAAAASDGPVFVEGEEGSGKSLACALAIRRSKRAEGPTIVVDCSKGGASAAGELFGQEEGQDGEVQWGALELCAEGTVVIEEPQALGPMAREILLRALRNGTFRRIGGNGDIPLRARVFVTRRLKPDEPSHATSPGTKSLFKGGAISVPPLRNRRKDIPEIVNTLIAKHGAALGFQNPQISKAAMERIVSYDWPGNAGELDAVIRRAFALAPEGRIEAEHVLIKLSASIKEGKVDLFRIPGLTRFLKSPLYPLVLQLPTLLVLGLIAVYCFAGPQTEDNFVLKLTWPIWWAALPLSFLFLGRIWCSICPFALVSSGIQKVGGLKLPIPKFFRKMEIWPMTVLFLFLTWADEFWHYPDFPWMTGVVLVSVFGGTVIMSVIFERRAWCRFFCPLGGVNGAYSSAAFVELRANIDVCANECTDHRCIAPGSKRPCPMLERPLAMDTNQNCNLCMNCLKECPHGAVHLFLRKPGAEIWEMRKPLISAGILSILLSGVMLLHSFCFYLEHCGLGLKDAPPAIWFGLATDEAAWTLCYLLIVVAILGIVMVAGAVSTGLENTLFSANLAHYGLSFAVMAVFMHITMEGGKFFSEGIPVGIALVSGWLGGSPEPADFALFTPLLVRLVQVFLGVCALVLTLYAIDRVSRQRGGGKRSPGALPFHVAATMVAIMFLIFISTSPLTPPAEAAPPAAPPVTAGQTAPTGSTAPPPLAAPGPGLGGTAPSPGTPDPTAPGQSAPPVAPGVKP